MNSVQILFTDVVSKYTNGNPVSEKEFKLMMEGLKKNQENKVDCNMSLTDCQKNMLKQLYGRLADSVKEYALESIRIEEKLIE